MGYKPQRKLFRLVFKEPELEGLEVTMKSLSIGDFLKMTGLTEAKTNAIDNAEELFRNFAKALVSWNVLDDDENPVPPNLEGVKSQELGFILGIITPWIDAMSSVAPPLPQSSNNGALSDLESSLNLDSLSASLPS